IADVPRVTVHLLDIDGMIEVDQDASAITPVAEKEIEIRRIRAARQKAVVQRARFPIASILPAADQGESRGGGGVIPGGSGNLGEFKIRRGFAVIDAFDNDFEIAHGLAVAGV